MQWGELQPDQSLRIQRTYSRGQIPPPRPKRAASQFIFRLPCTTICWHSGMKPKTSRLPAGSLLQHVHADGKAKAVKVSNPGAL